jgi:hypothetical protein
MLQPVSGSSRWDDLGPLVAAVRRLERRAEAHERSLQLMLSAVRLVHDDDRTLRRELRAARGQPGHAEAFDADAPLVSIIVPTWNNAEGLAGRSLPSALAQSYGHIEIVVVGDCSPPDVEAAVASFDDPRIRFYNLSVRGPYSEDPRAAWMSSGTPSYNAAAALARGLWLAPLADDDAFVPTHVEMLLALARSERLEFVYGRFARHWVGGDPEVLGRFPPELGQVALQASLYHRDLRLFELEFGDAVFDVPNDWGLVRRMLRAGVRFGMLDEIVSDYFPSGRLARITPPVEAEAEERLVDALVDRIGLLERRASEAEGRLAVVTASKSWRATRPLRSAASLLRRR